MTEPPKSASGRWELATWALLATMAALILLTFRDYGPSIDEEHGLTNGRYFVEWYTSGFTERAVVDAGNHRWYGSFFNAILYVAAKYSPLGSYDTAHLLIALTGLLGIFFAFRLGKRLAGARAGFLSALLLALTPLYYGHSFINPKDLPFAVLFLISIHYMIVAYDRLPTPGARLTIGLGILIGLTLGIRTGGVILFGYLVVLVGLWTISARGDNPVGEALTLRGKLRAAVLLLLGAGLTAWAVMLVWWPYAQLSPVLNPLRALRATANFTDFVGTTLYRGEFVSVDALPWHYLPTWFAITLPEFYGIVFAAGLLALPVAALKSGRRKLNANRDHAPKLVFLGFAILFPVVTAVITQPILYDGNRHFLFVVPPLAVLAGVTLAWLTSHSLPRPFRILVAALVIIAGAMTAFDMSRLHPLEYIHFNRSFGGLRAALGRYETDYWGLSHKEAVDWLIANYRPGAPDGSIRVATTALDFQTAYYLRGDRAETARFTPVNRREDPNVVLTVTRWNVHLRYRGDVLHVVRRMGTPLLYAIEVRR